MTKLGISFLERLSFYLEKLWKITCSNIIGNNKYAFICALKHNILPFNLRLLIYFAALLNVNYY